MTTKLFKVSSNGAKNRGHTTGSSGRTAKAELCGPTWTKKVPPELRRRIARRRLERRGKRIQS